MQTLSGTSKCPRCGMPLSAAAVENLCPRCVMEQLFLPPEPPSSGAEQPAVAARPFGSHDLLEIIGTGGMGVIWRARQRQLNRVVALKMIRAGLFASESDTKRFHAEAESVANLDHPNIVPIFEVGECDGNWFFSMPLIEGESLAQRLDRARRSEPGSKLDSPATPAAAGYDSREAARLIATIARAVHHAHQRGILHRDLKPGNILLDREGQPHITDFGLARRTSGASDLTMSGAVLGTPNYMSPEQASGKNREVTIASDTYGLGAILYELLTGHPPFQAETPLATLQKVVETEPAPPSSINHRADRQVEIICLKCLAKDPARRYATAAELADDLERWLRNEPILARPVSTSEQLMLWARRRPAVAALTLLALLLFLGGFAGVVWQWRRADASAVQAKMDADSAIRANQRASRHATEAEAALGRTREALWQANFDRARALRTSGGLGRRVKALEAIGAAAAIRPTPELREEAIAALALHDLEDSGVWRSLPENPRGMAIDAQHQQYALGFWDGRLEIRRFHDGFLLAARTNKSAPSLKLGFLPGSSRLFYCAAGNNVLWDFASNQVVLSDSGPAWLDFSANGRLLVRMTDLNAAVLVSIETGQETGRLAPTNSPLAAKFSPDGSRVLLSRGRSLEIWDASQHSRVVAAALPDDVDWLDWHPSGEAVLVGCEDRQLYLWQLRSQRLVRIGEHNREGVAPLWHPAGQLAVSVAWDQVLRLWEPARSSLIMETRTIRPAGFSSDGEWLAVQSARGLGRLRVHRSAECRSLHFGVELDGTTRPLAFSPDSRLLTVGGSIGVRVWELPSGQEQHSRPGSEVFTVAFLSTNSLMSSGREGVVLHTNRGGWSFGEPTGVSADGRQVVHLASPSRDGRVAIKVGGDGVVCSLASLTEPGIPPPLTRLAPQPFMEAFAFSPDGQWIASGYWNNEGGFGSEMWVRRAADGQPVRKIPMGNCRPFFSPDGRHFLAADNHDYRLFEVSGHPTNWPAVWHVSRDTTGFHSSPAAFSPDSAQLAVLADDQVVRLLDTRTARELARLTPPVPSVTDLAWSPDARWLALTTPAGVFVWDLELLQVQLRRLNLAWE